MPIHARIVPIGDSTQKSRANRRIIRLELPGTHASGESHNVLIRNMSTTGLLLETSEELKIGQELSIELPHSGGATVRIVWASNNLYGGQFQQEISPATLSAAQLLSPTRTSSLPSPEPQETESLGTRLRHLREGKGLSVAQLAQIVKVSKPTIYGWERDKTLPRQENVRSLVKALGVSSLSPKETSPRQESLVEQHPEFVSSSPDRPEQSLLGSKRFSQPVSSEARLAQLIAASKEQIAALAGTTAQKVKIILEF